MVSSLIVYGDFDFVRLVNGEVVHLVCPLVVSRGLGAPLDGIFHFDVHECFRPTTKATGGCVVNVGNFVDA